MIDPRFALAQAGDTEAEAELLAAHRGLIQFVAGRWYTVDPAMGPEDIESAALMGLVQAIRTYDPTRARFSTHARLCILAALYPIMSRSRRRYKHPCVSWDAVSDTSGWPLSQVTAADDPLPDDDFAATELREAVAAALSRIPAREAEVVRRHVLHGEQLKDIAADFGVSKTRIQQLTARGLQRIRATQALEPWR